MATPKAADGRPKKPSKTRTSSVSWAQAFRDVLVGSMNKGQFPLAIVGIIFMLILYKMTPQGVDRLVDRLLDGLVAYSLVGWAVSGPLVAGWYLHSKWQRRTIQRELDRVTEERNRLQTEKLEGKPKSSEARR